jgi:hydrogenase maturation protein HypF
LRQEVNYEAQAAMELEALIDPDETGKYSFEISDQTLNPDLMLRQIIADLRRGAAVSTIAARFHNTVAAMILEACVKLRSEVSLNRVVLSGGVWQNLQLLERALRSLEDAGFDVLVHNRIPANDGGLALGQAAAAAQIAAGKTSSWLED